MCVGKRERYIEKVTRISKTCQWFCNCIIIVFDNLLRIFYKDLFHVETSKKIYCLKLYDFNQQSLFVLSNAVINTIILTKQPLYMF